MTNNLDIVLTRIKTADPDRFRAAQLADAAARERLMWVYTFHLELAKVPELVSEPMIGDIRYQWWRDAVEEIYSGKPIRKHEVTTPLAKVLVEADIPRFWVDKLIDGRHSDLQPETFENVDAARKYCADTSGVLAQIATRCLNQDLGGDVALEAGTAWGLTGLCRAYPFYHNTVLANVPFEDLKVVTSAAYSELRSQKIDTAILPAIAYAGLIPKYLNKMSAADYNPKTDAVTLSPFAKQLRQLKITITGRI